MDKLYVGKIPNSCEECPLTYLDSNKRRCAVNDSCIDGMVSKRGYDCPLVEAIPKNQYEARLKENNKLVNDLEELRTMINKFVESYENRLKDEVIAMLRELIKEINPMKECEQQIYGKDSWGFVGKCQDTIQQKIDKLKAEQEK